MKRFYAKASPVRGEGGFEIHLDGRPVKAHSGQPLKAPNETLANLVAAEWNAQQGTIKPDSMPVMQILTTVIGTTPEMRKQIETSVMDYLNTDLLCYRAREPEALAARQAQFWDPWLNWFEEKSGTRLQTTTDLAALTQPVQAHDYARAAITGADPWVFHAIQMTTALSGSLVLALAFSGKSITPDDLFAAAQVEELYRAEIYNEALYGPDPAQEKSQAALRRDLDALWRILHIQP